MNKLQTIIVITISVLTMFILSLTIMSRDKEIAQLEKELSEQKFKYKMIYRAPFVREVIQSGG